MPLRGIVGLITSFLLAVVILVPAAAARAAVVINEIFYNAPNDLDSLQWIELYNPGDVATDLSDWTLDEGKTFAFPKGASIAAKGYVVITLQPDVFSRSYRAAAAPVGRLYRPLKRGGETLRLCNPAKTVVDTARYKDSAPWPLSPDGSGSSLERICPSASGEAPENWAASALSAGAPVPGGTPGRQNASFSPAPLPTIAAAAPADISTPGQALRVEADVKDAKGVAEVSLLYRTITNEGTGEEAAVPMALNDAKRYVAEIPAQAAGTLVRYRIVATNSQGARRYFPDENDLRNTLSTYVNDKWEQAPLPLAMLMIAGPHKQRPAAVPADAAAGAGAGAGAGAVPPGNTGAAPRGTPRPITPADIQRAFTREAVPVYRPGNRYNPGGPRPARGSTAFIYFDSATKKATLFDHVHAAPRNNGGGYKVFLHKDKLLNGMTAVNFVWEGVERFLLAEHLAYDLYRRAGSPAPLTEFVRVKVDGRQAGYHLMMERLNRSFLRRNKVDDNGSLYKLLWYGNGVIGQHEKRTHPEQGHEDLIAVLALLQRTPADQRWKVIQQHFDVNQTAAYFAVNMVLSHWDGYFNNYFAYFDSKGTKKWMMFPWDQDKTWGYYDSIASDECFFYMPITHGMEGDRPPGGVMQGSFGGGSDAPWWRRPGHFSGPLLGTPEFRKVFLTKTKELLEKHYTPEVYFPMLDQLAERLKTDSAMRNGGRFANANLNDDSPRSVGLGVQSLKKHLVMRRKFLLDQKELRELQPAAPASPPANAPANQAPGVR